MSHAKCKIEGPAAGPFTVCIQCLRKMLYLVGLGLADETDITVKGLDVVKKAERVYLEAYTSILLVDKEKLVSPLGCLVSAFGNTLVIRLGLMFSLISRKLTMADL